MLQQRTTQILTKIAVFMPINRPSKKGNALATATMRRKNMMYMDHGLRSYERRVERAAPGYVSLLHRSLTADQALVGS